jgi:hypothetical protein
MKTIARGTVTRLLGNGRSRVRATFASYSRSAMSLRVQPAPRIATAPIANSSNSTGSGQAGLASAMPHQPGNSNSHVPIGRSSRASRA